MPTRNRNSLIPIRELTVIGMMRTFEFLLVSVFGYNSFIYSKKQATYVKSSKFHKINCNDMKLKDIKLLQTCMYKTNLMT